MPGAFFAISVLGTIPAGLAEYGLVGPSLLWPETLSALRDIAWRGSLDDGEAYAAAQHLSRLGVTQIADDRLPVAAYDVARELGWAKTYDAEYVALARLLDLPLLTRDVRLRRGAARLVRLFEPS